MTTAINHWPAYQKRWEFKGTPEEAVIFSGANGGYEARMQYEFMLSRGLRAQHSFLDLGCGALRGTIRLVDYLNGGFYGCDISVGLLEQALLECQRLTLKNLPILKLMDSFDLKTLWEGMAFDFILCNSVTVHVDPDDIPSLLRGIGDVLTANGKAYISIHPLDENQAEPFRWDGYRWWYKRSWLVKEAVKLGLAMWDKPGKLPNRMPGRAKPVIPIVNTNMTEWMMEMTR